MGMKLFCTDTGLSVFSLPHSNAFSYISHVTFFPRKDAKRFAKNYIKRKKQSKNYTGDNKIGNNYESPYHPLNGKTQDVVHRREDEGHVWYLSYVS
jgi:hypothetical protein